MQIPLDGLHEFIGHKIEGWNDDSKTHYKAHILYNYYDYLKREMKKITLLSCLLYVLLSCSNKGNSSIVTISRDVDWENSDLNRIYFDSIFVYISHNAFSEKGEMYKYHYVIMSDILEITDIIYNNKTQESKDTIFTYKIEHANKDSFKLKAIKSNIKNPFSGFLNLTFYNMQTTNRFQYYIEKDSNCLEQVDKAQDDISKNKLVFLDYSTKPFRQKLEFISLLNKNNISYVDLGPYPDVLPSDRNCYKETMDYYIRKKYGKNFISDLMKRADTLMIQNNLLFKAAPQ